MDANHRIHGFLRAKNGTFTTFDVPESIRTSVISISQGKVLTGSYEDANNVQHGFLRTP